MPDISMTELAKIYESLGTLHAKVDIILTDVREDHEARIRILERGHNVLRGAWALLVAAVGFGWVSVAGGFDGFGWFNK